MNMLMNMYMFMYIHVQVHVHIQYLHTCTSSCAVKLIFMYIQYVYSYMWMCDSTEAENKFIILYTEYLGTPRNSVKFFLSGFPGTLQELMPIPMEACKCRS